MYGVTHRTSFVSVTSSSTSSEEDGSTKKTFEKQMIFSAAIQLAIRSSESCNWVVFTWFHSASAPVRRAP